jgi:hypothetical protein
VLLRLVIYNMAQRTEFVENSRDRQTRWYLFTLPYESYHPFFMDDSVRYARGQCEISPTGYWHWHIVVCFHRTQRWSFAKTLAGDNIDIQPVRNRDAAIEYVWKDRTSLPFTRFDHGIVPIRRASRRDWEDVYDNAKEGNFDAIDPSVIVQHYHNLKRIRSDYQTPPVRMSIELFIYWGVTGSGKSTRAYQEAKEDGVYFKSSSNKWWDSYRGEKNVIIDEFQGKVSIDHLLRWVNWLPCLVETKGGTVPLLATTFWITSNVNPRAWWDNVPKAQEEAFARRITSEVYFDTRYSE